MPPVFANESNRAQYFRQYTELLDDFRRRTNRLAHQWAEEFPATGQPWTSVPITFLDMTSTLYVLVEHVRELEGKTVLEQEDWEHAQQIGRNLCNLLLGRVQKLQEHATEKQAPVYIMDHLLELNKQLKKVFKHTRYRIQNSTGCLEILYGSNTADQ